MEYFIFKAGGLGEYGVFFIKVGFGDFFFEICWVFGFIEFLILLDFGESGGKETVEFLEGCLSDSCIFVVWFSKNMRVFYSLVDIRGGG